ncbi:hypothetical protein NPIL_276751 [Nephila pilipes]|uniref:Uncharacterized protein n=1 Tax=Nephila pilipes TaxID=299642 RepID=A0A8X6PCE5_NEPPI|nr:hypothetical protein NPIL_276751 [Nephila pilipes]
MICIKTRHRRNDMGYYGVAYSILKDVSIALRKDRAHRRRDLDGIPSMLTYDFKGSIQERRILRRREEDTDTYTHSFFSRDLNIYSELIEAVWIKSRMF